MEINNSLNKKQLINILTNDSTNLFTTNNQYPTPLLSLKHHIEITKLCKYSLSLYFNFKSHMIIIQEIRYDF